MKSQAKAVARTQSRIGAFLAHNGKAAMFAGAIGTFIASVISMAMIYGDPLAHVRICLGAQAEVSAGYEGLLLYGHCGWCYLALGMAIAAFVMPAKAD